MPGLNISRDLQTPDRRGLQKHFAESQELDPRILWLPLGRLTVTLVSNRYSKYNIHAGALSLLPPEEVAQDLNRRVLPDMPGRNQPIEAQVTGVQYLSGRRCATIAYALDSPMLERQRRHIVDQLNEMNGTDRRWGDFHPHIPVATIPTANQSEAVLEAFRGYAPESFVLNSALARVTGTDNS